jgi:hypothetical protein
VIRALQAFRYDPDRPSRRRREVLTGEGMLLKLVLRQFVLQRIVLRNICRIRGLRGALHAAALAACAIWFVPSAAAGIRAVEPGTAPTLDDGEALLLIGIDTDVTLGSVRVVRSGMNFVL